MDADVRARKQLGRVLLLLGALDSTVLCFVVVLAVERGRWGLSNADLAAAISLGACLVILARLFLAVRLKTHRGDLA